MTRALCSKLESRSFHCVSSLRRLDLSVSNVSFPCGGEFPSVTTSVSQLSGRDLGNNKADTSSARGMSKETVSLINP